MDTGGTPDGEQHADDRDWVLLARYFAGECSAAERADVERWAAEPGRRAELAALRRWWEQSAVLPSASKLDAMWQRLSEEMHAPATGDARVESPAPARRARVSSPPLTLTPKSAPRAAGWRRVTGLAAGLLLALGGAGLWRVARDSSSHVAPAAEAPMREFATKPGQRATISLVDGTTVTLGVASTLRVRPYDRAAPGPREVYLEGEAVFDVAHDERRPFLVHSRRAVTEDLGTRFGVRAYAGDTLVRVVVAAGKVALRPSAAPAGSGALLGPGDLGRLDDGGRAVVERGVDAAAYLAWTDGRLVFHDVPLGEVATQLGRWFDVTIDVPAGVAKRRVTLDMPARALTDVLDAVTVPLGLRYDYDRHGGTVRVAR